MKNQGAKVQEKAEAKSTPKKKAVAKAKGSPKKPGPKAKASQQAVKGLLKNEKPAAAAQATPKSKEIETEETGTVYKGQGKPLKFQK